MKLQTTKYLYEYWNELRGTRMAPSRRELDPNILKDILPNLFLLDRKTSDGYDFRLAGTRVCNLFGDELRDKNFLDLWSENDRDSFISLFNTLSEQGAAIICGLKGVSQQQDVNFEFLALPLFQAQTNHCSSIIGSFGFSEEVEHNLFLPITDIEMVSLRVIWPVENKTVKPKAVVNKNSLLQIAIAQDAAQDHLARRARFKLIQGGKL